MFSNSIESRSRYLDVEKLFQFGHYDKVISTLRQTNKDNIDVVVDRVFAHTQYKNRNLLITTMLDKLWHEEPRLIKNMKPTLQGPNSIYFCTLGNGFMDIFLSGSNKI